MNKRILCLCFILIAFLGISSVSAVDVDNLTIENSNFVLHEPDSFQSLNDAVRLNDGQVLDFKYNTASENGSEKEICVNLSEDNSPSIPNDIKSNISNMDNNERAKIAKDDTNLSGIGLISFTEDTKSSSFNPGTFLSEVKDDELIALDFDPATGILKVNPDCPYMKSDCINSTELKWFVSAYNDDYLNESARCNYCRWEIGEAYPTRYSKEFNITEFISNARFPLWFTDGYLTCKITVEVLGAKDFSIDFEFPVRKDEFNNVKYLPLQKSVAHISGNDFVIYDNHKTYLNLPVPINQGDMIKLLIITQLMKNN